MNHNGDDWKHNGAVGVAEREAGDTKGEPLTHLSLDDEENDKTESPTISHGGARPAGASGSPARRSSFWS